MVAIGRPKIEIDLDLAEDLASIMCTQEEIAAVLKVSVDTLQRNEAFCTMYKKVRETAKGSLRRAQWKSAMAGNTTMLIWLGKQFLAQKDMTKQEIAGEDGKKIEIRVIRDE